MRLVLVGGSGSATPELADALGDWPGGIDRRPELEIVLVARARDRLELVAGELRRRCGSLDGAPVRVLAETDLRSALEAAGVVVNAVRVGGLAARAFDETFPLSHGVPGEETMGPGGLANAMRSIPVARRIWATVADVAPDALHINLANPSGMVAAAVARDPGLQLLSVCDSPVTFCDGIAERLKASPDEVRQRYVGMNHLGWWVPRDDAELEATIDLVVGQEPEAVRAQGALGAAYVRYYVHPDRILASQRSAGETRAQQLQQLEAKLLAGYADRQAELPRRGAVWYARAVLPVVDAWVNGSPDVLTVGLRNDGRIAGLPDDVITEGPARIARPGMLESLAAPALPALPAAMLARHAAYERLAVDAGSEAATPADRVRAMMANPMVGSWDLATALVADIDARSPA